MVGRISKSWTLGWLWGMWIPIFFFLILIKMLIIKLINVLN